jgi:hypothetical protein
MHQILKRRKMKRLISLLLLLSISTLGVFASANYHPEKVPVLKTEYVLTPTQDHFVVTDYTVLEVPTYSIDRTYEFSIDNVILNNEFKGFYNFEQESYNTNSFNDQPFKFEIDSNSSFYRSLFSTTDITHQILTGDNLKYLSQNFTSELGFNTYTLDNHVLNPVLNALQDNTDFQKLLFRSCQVKSFKLFR